MSWQVVHVTSRGDGRDDIYLSDADRESWLDVFGQVCERYYWILDMSCLVPDEQSLPPPDRDAGGESCAGNAATQRRLYAAVERDGYLLELARYVVLNPLRARTVARLEDWPWGSYPATCAQVPSPSWLQTDGLLSQFGQERASAIGAYVAFVHEGRGLPSIWCQLQGQIFLGSESFIRNMLAQTDNSSSLDEIVRQFDEPDTYARPL